MTKKNSENNKDKEIWSRKFEDNEDNENNKNSRSARKKAKGGISPMATSLFIFLALLIILPTVTVLMYMNGRDNTEGFKADDDKITVTQNSSSEESSSEEKSSSKKESVSEESSTLDVPTKSESKIENEIVEEAPEQTVPEEVPEAPVAPEPEVEQPVEEPTVEETGSTYTVVAGDNLYRIALNHGMTTEQLKNLNGLSTNEVSVGTVLKVN